jgi:GTP cyclohydrolase II
MNHSDRAVEDLLERECLPHVIPPEEHNRFYLKTMARRSGHWIDFSGRPHLVEQNDPIRVEKMVEVD